MKIKKDKHGIYARVDGYVCRPFPYDKSIFQEGEELRGSHPAGPTAYIRRGKRGQDDYIEEIWETKCCHWWHPIEGRGKSSAELRGWDLKRSPLPKDAYKEKF